MSNGKAVLQGAREGQATRDLAASTVDISALPVPVEFPEPAPQGQLTVDGGIQLVWELAQHTLAPPTS